MARLAAIDLGSNAFRLRVVDVNGPGGAKAPSGESVFEFSEVSSQRAPVRLGTEVFRNGYLGTTLINQACGALREFRRAMDDAHVEAYRATATSAAREAQDADLLVDRARREAGIDIEIIEGVEEARLVRLAVSRRCAVSDKRLLLVDVGGGSTEFTYLEEGAPVLSVSLPLGSVRLLETYLQGEHPLPKKQLRLVDETIWRELEEVVTRLGPSKVDFIVGTGGNVDTLADLAPFPGGHMGAKAISVPAMKQLSARLFGMSAQERRTSFNLKPDRADTILPATRIFLHTADKLNMGAIVAPGVGLKEGLLMDLCDKFFHETQSAKEADFVFEACKRLGSRFHFDEAHGQRVASFAATLFDATTTHHRLVERDRLLLRIAGLLHDIGDFVRYDGHHKHTYYLIQNSDIIGLTPGEREIVANVARYHRKGGPDITHSNFKALSKDDRTKVRALAALLRIADALDREHLGRVTSLEARVDQRKLCLELGGTMERDLEEWTAQAKSDLLQEALGLSLVLSGQAPVSRIPGGVAT